MIVLIARPIFTSRTPLKSNIVRFYFKTIVLTSLQILKRVSIPYFIVFRRESIVIALSLSAQRGKTLYKLESNDNYFSVDDHFGYTDITI